MNFFENKPAIPFHPHILVRKSQSRNFSLARFLEALYPKELIEWVLEPDFKEIDTYILLYICHYGVEEGNLLIESIHRAEYLLGHQLLKSHAHILIILYRDLKVAFPERKLQREKFMSEMITKEILDRENPFFKEQIFITHEFGTHRLQDSLQQLNGRYLYFDIQNISYTNPKK